MLAMMPVAAFAQATPAASGTAQETAAGQPSRAPDSFFITAFDVTGVTRLSSGDIEKAVYGFTGPNRGGKDVDNARKAVQAAYAARGYEAVVVEIPPQDTALFKQGVVQLRVNEAPVGEVRVVDAHHHSAKGVLRNVPSVKLGEPVDLKALQSDLAEANRYPDRMVAPGFKPGKDPGTIDVELKVQDKLPLHASLDLNNDSSPSTTDLRLNATVRYTNLWGLGHSVSATYMVAPKAPKESTVFSGSYLAPFIGTPWSVLLYGYRSNSNVAALGGTNVLGNGYQVGLRGIYKLPTKSTNQSISLGFDFKDFKQRINVGEVSAGSTPITYVPMVAEYTIAGAGEHSQFDITLGATAGLRLIKRIVGYDTTSGRCTPSKPCAIDQFSDKAVDSTENFVHVNLNGSAQFATKSDIVFKAGFSGQLANSHLVANEQFGLGGLSSVRGYHQSEAVADDGINGTFELQSPSLAPYLFHFVDELRFYGFVDGGYTWLLGTIAKGQVDHYSLLGAGGGFRIKLFQHVLGEALVGVPMLSGPVSHAGDPRFTFQVKSEF